VRLVLDTNTIISGLLWQGTPGKLLEAAQTGRVSLFTTVPLLAELQGVLNREKFAHQIKVRGFTVTDFFYGYIALASLITPADISPTIVRDPADDAVLACALAAQAELIISGDTDLLTLQEYQGIRIVDAATAMALIEQQR
jgi:putative toxin-antitoxin system toxin component, PIN family